MRVFVSYSHKQSDWVRDDLVSVLEAGGAGVLVDWKEFEAGRTVVGQMDGTQDKAERHVLCLSADYIGSAMCLHEMRRAVAVDPHFKNGTVLPLRLDGTPMPPEVSGPDPIWVDFNDRVHADSWRLLLKACSATLGVGAPGWLAARGATVAELQNGNSVNLVAAKGVRGEELAYNLPGYRIPGLAVVDLTDPGTVTRTGLCRQILEALGTSVPSLARKPDDLRDFSDHLQQLGRRARVALVNFDIAVTRKDYDSNFYATLRWLVTEPRWLQLLVHSHRPFATLLPKDNPLSSVDLKTIELR